jgi:fumarylacetoacetase
MTSPLDATHDPALRSWVESANAADSDFPIQNLPFGRFRRAGSAEAWRMGVAIGDRILDLRAATEQCPWDGEVHPLLQPLAAGDLKAFMALGVAARRTLRRALSRALAEHSEQGPFLELCLVAQAEAQMSLPFEIGDYTDFYTGIHHATAVGRLFRPDAPLLPNYKWVPIGYHGRSSSIVVSGTPFHRPRGQTKGEGEVPVFGPSRRLDYELELGAVVGRGNELGQPVAMRAAEEHLFGLVLLNDWSARDLQAWEYQPLGPFLAKNFHSTVSPWVVTSAALAPFRLAQPPRPEGDPAPLPYLLDAGDQAHGAYAIEMGVCLLTAKMREAGLPPERLSMGPMTAMYWTAAQLVAHHTVNGCNLQPGDLLGTGTLSSERRETFGSLLELSEGGKSPLTLANGETRTFLEDGDEVIMTAHAVRDGRRGIGFGECRARIAG